jgi:hypothetical protein
MKPSGTRFDTIEAVSHPADQSRHRTRLVAAAFSVAALTGCSSSASEPSTGSVGAPDGRVSDASVMEIVDDLNQYWSTADAELGFEYQPVSPDRVSTGGDGVTCDRAEIEAEEVEDNAFVDSGCAEGITVAYDPDYVLESLARAEVTLAHEWGHVIQAQAADLDLSLDPDGLPIDAELQADCFAGAWAADRAAADLEDMRIDVAESGDPHGVAIDDPDSHGTDQERLDAFNVGHAGGPTACVDELVAVLPG